MEKSIHPHDACCGACAVKPGEKRAESKIRPAITAAGAALFAAALLANPQGPARLWLFLAAYALLGWDVVLRALMNFVGLKLRNVFDENFLMSLATISAFFIGEYPEAAAVMLFYKAGEYFQGKAVANSRKSIKSLAALMPEYANEVRAGGTRRVSPAKVPVGALIRVLPGERVPLDGIIVSGETELNLSALTGESAPVFAGEGAEIFSGSINLNGAIEVRTTKTYEDSAAAKILELVENAASVKAPAEKFITKFARVYTPVVVLSAGLLAVVPPLLGFGLASDWLYRALVFLVVSCPCALVISVPLSFFRGIGEASRQGILIKGGNILQELEKTDVAVFDKTGTLTKGKFEVIGVNPAEGVSEAELIAHALALESFSNHPAAKAVVSAFRGREEETLAAMNAREIPGQGIEALINGETALCGNERLMKAYGISVPEFEDSGFTAVHAAAGGRYLGRVIIADALKADAARAVSGLKAMGAARIVMLTGDKLGPAKAAAREAGISEVYAELLPGEKLAVIEKMYRDNPGAKIIFAGDGINDAPVLARCGVGFAMGGIGSGAAIEAADAVIVGDEPSKVCGAVKIAGQTMRLVRQNIFLALAVKLGVLALGAFGLAGLWFAVFADVGVTLIVILNSARPFGAK